MTELHAWIQTIGGLILLAIAVIGFFVKTNQDREKVVKKIEEKMVDEEEEAPLVAKKQSKKRALVEEDDEEVATIEENVPTPSKPAPVSTPGKQSAAKKLKANDAKEIESIKTVSKETPP